MDVDLKIKKAKIEVALSHPFFAYLLFRREIIKNYDCKTARTDGEIIEINPNFIEKLSISETVFLFCHEILHIANLHHLRIGDRDIKIWNKAADYVINLMLFDSGFTLIPNCLFDISYRDMSVEQVYELVKENSDDKDSIGDVVSPTKSAEDLKFDEKEILAEISSALAVSKLQGKLPNSLDVHFTDSISHKVDWKEVTNQFIKEIEKTGYNFLKPNRRFLHTGFALPSLHKEVLKPLLFFVDTSASMDEIKLKKVFAEINNAISGINIKIIVVYCDTTVQKVETIYPNSNQKLSPRGGGGTSFIPPFDYIEKKEIDGSGIIYFTDGDCNLFPENLPNLPMLWVCTEKYFNPPFGEVIHI